jgi:uncharacterized membrane protein
MINAILIMISLSLIFSVIYNANCKKNKNIEKPYWIFTVWMICVTTTLFMVLIKALYHLQ